MRLDVEGNQLILEAGQEDRWLVTDMPEISAQNAKESLLTSRDQIDGLQFIAIQSSPDEQSFAGFWMLRDLKENQN